MKVICRILIDGDGRALDSCTWMTVGKTYHVLAISYDEQHKFMYRILGDSATTPALFDPRQFEVVSGRVPGNWVVNVDADGFELSPAPWLALGFWNRFFDGDKDAVKIFEEEMRTVISADP